MRAQRCIDRCLQACFALAALLSAAEASAAPGDFGGDGETDLAVWRPSDGNWNVVDSVTNQSWSVGWGWPGDIPVPGDYDGDGKADVVQWRPSDGTWKGMGSSNWAYWGKQWGSPGDRPIPGDYDGDGKTDVAVWRPSDGNWYVVNSSTNQWWSVGWGWPGDVPVPGDYDGDGKTDVVAWRPSDGMWKGMGSSDWAYWGKQWGSPGDIPVPGDYDGDGKTDVAVWRPSGAFWYIIHSSTGQVSTLAWGAPTDIPVAADYDGDCKTDIAAWRPSDGKWRILHSTTGAAVEASWGSSGDVPVVRTGAALPCSRNERLVRKFAPRLRFDGDAHGFPMSAQQFYNAAVAQPQAGRVENTSAATLGSGTIPTYYQVTTCGNQVRIKYWWFYGYQTACDGSGNGTHNGDWEQVMVTLSEDTSSIAAVTFWMHGEHYTRLATRGGFALEGESHPVVHVGKHSHAAFYNQGGSGETCLPWEEYRNNGGGLKLDSWQNLKSLDAGAEPWMLADRQGNFAWGAGGINTHPTTNGPHCTMNAAAWSTNVPTWWHSQCKTGDRDDGSLCHTQCEPGYSDMGYTCTDDGGAFWDTYSQDLYNYDYELPTSNLGLLSNDYDN